MFDGLEIDMLSLGDADSILVTQWTSPAGYQSDYPFRVLIDGGSTSDADAVKGFLAARQVTHIYAVTCTHPHRDHAGGLIQLLKDRSISCTTGWMHDIRKHFSADTLRRASAGRSSQAKEIAEILETTRDLASAFATRGVTPQEPFSGQGISFFPPLTVLGPSVSFYKSILSEVIDEPPTFAGLPPYLGLAAGPSSPPPFPSSLYQALLKMPPADPAPQFSSVPPAIGSPWYQPSTLSALAGVLSGSSVKENPTTQPFNNTSAILGGLFRGNRFVLTADGGAEALNQIPREWANLTWMQVPHHGSDGNLSQELIERLCPHYACISASGNESHPSRAIVSGLVKVGSEVYSTHLTGHLWYYNGSVPRRLGYSKVEPMRGTGSPQPVTNWNPWLPGGLRPTRK